MAIAENWHIRSRSHTCSLSGETFHDGEKMIAAILPDSESSGWLRNDFSLSSWEIYPEKEKVFSHWQTIYKAPVAEQKVEIVKESPEALLRRLVTEDHEHTEKVRFILAVMLERQKILRETDTQKVPSGILRVYEHRKDGDVFLIKDPNISLDQVEHIQAEVISLIEGDQQSHNIVATE